MYIRYINTYINPKSYSNPIVKYMDTYGIMIGTNIPKKSNIRFTKSKLIDDSGLFIESYNTTKYLNLQEIKNDVNPRKTPYIVSFSIESSSFITKTVRSYMKIQELIAKIGGLLNGLKLLVTIMINGYVSFSYYYKIYEILTINREKSDSVQENL